MSDILLAKLAGWEVVKQARALVAAGRVLSSEWQPPHLRGVVQEGSATYRAELVIRSEPGKGTVCRITFPASRCINSPAVETNGSAAVAA